MGLLEEYCAVYAELQRLGRPAYTHEIKPAGVAPGKIFSLLMQLDRKYGLAQIVAGHGYTKVGKWEIRMRMDGAHTKKFLEARLAGEAKQKFGAKNLEHALSGA